MALSDRSLKLGISYDHGIDFSEYTGQLPMPETSSGTIKIIDENNNIHILVLNYSDGCFYDIAMRDGPEGSLIINELKDKVEADGTGGYDIEPEVSFKEDTGEYERFVLEHDISNIYVRPLHETDRNTTGHDINGYLSDTEFTTEIYVDGEPFTYTAKSKKIPLGGEIVYDKKVEGNRIKTTFKSNKSGFRLVGRQQEYIVKDINYNPDIRVLNEGLCQQAISDIYRRITRNNPTLEKVTNFTIDGTVTTGPDLNSSAVSVSSGTVLFNIPTVSSLTQFIILVWIKKENIEPTAFFSIDTDDINITSTEYEINDFVLYYSVININLESSGKAFLINSDAEIFDFRLIKNTTSLTIDDITEYMYKDGDGNSFDNICPFV